MTFEWLSTLLFLISLSIFRYLHNEGVAHFDLKPSNILLTSGRRPVLKLADFGLALRLPGRCEAEGDERGKKEEVGPVSGVRGSYLYMAPEILKKEARMNKFYQIIRITLFHSSDILDVKVSVT